MTGFDDSERRARQLCERAGIPWQRADAEAWRRLAEMEDAERNEHTPKGWQIVAALSLVGIGAAVWLWVACGGGR